MGVASRRGLGKVRHIDVTQLWLQQVVSNHKLTLVKVPSKFNLADSLTKHVDAPIANFHVVHTNQVLCPSRHALALTG